MATESVAWPVEALRASDAPEPELSIVIPAYNEERGIVATVERTLAALSGISAAGPVQGIEVIVVDDGSTDRTAELVTTLPGARLIRHPRNRGYGAALKTGFAAARGQWLAFMDGDGTCDPAAFGALCRALRERSADLVIGTRLGEGSRMPGIRRFGNRFYAQVVRLWAQRQVTDVASGMRVMRRSAYDALEPLLPDGLHFTPAMSCRALLDDRLAVAEVAIPYIERIGQSKLRVLEDGWRFLRTIVEIAVLHRPWRLFGLAGAALLAMAAVVALWAAWSSVSRPLGDWLAFRMTVIMASASAGLALVTTGVEAQRLVDGALGRPALTGRGGKLLSLVLHCERHGMLYGLALAVVAITVLWVKPVQEYLAHHHLANTWPWFLFGGILGLTAVQLAALGILGFVVNGLAREGRGRAQ